jgi:type II restriction enzyme
LIEHLIIVEVQRLGLEVVNGNSLDEDGTFQTKELAKKARAIVEQELDGSYVLSQTNIEESTKVKMFDKFIDDLQNLV